MAETASSTPHCIITSIAYQSTGCATYRPDVDNGCMGVSMSVFSAQLSLLNLEPGVEATSCNVQPFCKPICHTCLAVLCCKSLCHPCLAVLPCIPFRHPCLAVLCCKPFCHPCLAVLRCSAFHFATLPCCAMLGCRPAFQLECLVPCPAIALRPGRVSQSELSTP